MKARIKLLVTLLSVLCLLLVVYVLDTTVSRYIKQERDEIYATYTSLMFESNVQNGAAVLENDVAYFNFKLMNFIDEDITKREIEYKVVEPSYIDSDKKDLKVDEKGKLTYLEGGATYTGEKLYVKDVWGEPVEIGKNTNMYKIEMISNDGEINANSNYVFPYELGTEGQADTHSLTVKLTRKVHSNVKVNEQISIVVQLIQPYSEVYIINLKIVEKLITYNVQKIEKFGADFLALSLQTANIFSYSGSTKNEFTINGTNYTISPKGFEVIVEFDNIYFNKIKLNSSHAIPGGESSNIDISKTYLKSLDNDISDGKGSVKLYIPQSADFTLEFLPLALPSGETYKFQITFNVLLVDGKGNEVYKKYTLSLGGYEEFDNTGYIDITVDDILVEG